MRATVYPAPIVAGSAEIEIRLNGAPYRLPAGRSVADLVASLALAPERVAIERNCALVRRAELASTPLREGDEVEIVTLVGGG